MNWRVVGKSSGGTSHERVSTRCQDACAFNVTEVENGEVALLVVSDGAGSAAYSHAGALAAVDAVLEFLYRHIEANGSADLDLGTLQEAVAYARAAVVERAAELEVSLADVSCTLLVAILTPSATYAAHIGDGAIVLDEGDVLCALSWPEQGEYANTTYFLSGDDGLERVRYAEAGAARRVALLTDGLQHIALDYAERKPFEEFFEPFFSYLETSSASDDEIIAQLERYLSSDAVTSRTDDDKTLVLAVRR